MTNIITLIVLVSSVGIVLVYGECLTNDAPIESCCCLGYNNTYFNARIQEYTLSLTSVE